MKILNFKKFCNVPRSPGLCLSIFTGSQKSASDWYKMVPDTTTGPPRSPNGSFQVVMGRFQPFFSHFKPNFSRKLTNLDFSDLLNSPIMSNIPIRGNIVNRGNRVGVPQLSDIKPQLTLFWHKTAQMRQMGNIKIPPLWRYLHSY